MGISLCILYISYDFYNIFTYGYLRADDRIVNLRLALIIYALMPIFNSIFTSLATGLRIRKKVIPSIRQKIVSLYENGNTYKIIAAATDVTTGTVGSILKQAGVVRRQTVTGFPVPDTNPNSPKTYGKGYWHMNLNIPKKSLGTMSKVTSKLTCGPNGYPNKSSMLMG